MDNLNEKLEKLKETNHLEYMKITNMQERIESYKVIINKATEGIAEYEELLKEFKYVQKQIRRELRKAKMWIYLDFTLTMTEVKYDYIECAENLLKEILEKAQAINDKVNSKEYKVNYDGNCHISEDTIDIDFYAKIIYMDNGAPELYANSEIKERISDFEEQVYNVKEDFFDTIDRFERLIEETHVKIKQEQEILDKLIESILE